MAWLDFSLDFLSPITGEIWYKSIGYGIWALLLVLVYPLTLAALRYIQQVYVFFQTRGRALSAVSRVGTRRDKYEGDGPWVSIPVQHPEHYETNIRAAKILAVANYKGGVGKTTFAANVAACIAKEHQKSVLLIDLDFQGSLSSMAIASDDWQPAPKQPSLASRAISGDIAPSELTQFARSIWTANEPEQTGKLDLISAHYDVASADSRLMVEWLLKPRKRRSQTWRQYIGHLYTGKVYQPYDLRYVLTELLHNQFARTYDLIIIDCPPRLTAGSMQALCASSHLIIPAIMDKPSTEAVMKYADQINTLKKLNICPYLNLIGIVPTKVRPVNATTENVLRLERQKERGLLDVDVVPVDCFIPMTVKVADAQEDGIAYFALGNSDDEKKLKDAIKNGAGFVMQNVGV